MAWKVFLLDNIVETCSLIVLLGAAFFSYKLVIDDKKIGWNIVTIAIAFLALSIGFSILDKTTKIGIFDIAEHMSVMISALMFLGVLSIAKKYKDGLR